MSDEFERAFGGATRTSFVERVTIVQKSPELENAESETVAYRAFGFLPANGISDTCDVQRWSEDKSIPEGVEFQYRFLLQVGYRGSEEIRLYLPDLIILIEGQCLDSLRKKLARRQVTFICQHNRAKWPLINSAGQPVVERIGISRPRTD